MSKAPSPVVFFPDDLIIQIISLLSVKPLVRFKCVSNSWNNLISNPTFVKFHFKRSKTSPNPHFTLITHHMSGYEDEDKWDDYEDDWSIIPYPISRLVDNPSAAFVADSYYLLNLREKEWSMAGSCNGLICLVRYGFINKRSKHQNFQDYWLRLWNPATRKISQNIGYFRNSFGFVFNFGCDDSTGMFKVVASRVIRDGYTTEVRVFTIGDNVWRDIESFPTVPLGLGWRGQLISKTSEYGCVFLNTTLNWLAMDKDVGYYWAYHNNLMTVKDLVIVSLDLKTETYNQYRLPQGFDKLPPEEPTIGVLEECLCFCYSYKETDIVIWQMMKFGVEDSWIQFLKISYHILQLDYDISFLPLFLSKDGGTLVLCCSENKEAILYNRRDNNMQRIEVEVHKTIDNETQNYLYLNLAQGYVESLISIC